jgi:hypothetical protein
MMGEAARAPMFQAWSLSAREQVRLKNLKPISSVDELVCDVWESDKELDEFLADLYASRHMNVA